MTTKPVASGAHPGRLVLGEGGLVEQQAGRDSHDDGLARSALDGAVGEGGGPGVGDEGGAAEEVVTLAREHVQPVRRLRRPGHLDDHWVDTGRPRHRLVVVHAVRLGLDGEDRAAQAAQGLAPDEPAEQRLVDHRLTATGLAQGHHPAPQRRPVQADDLASDVEDRGAVNADELGGSLALAGRCRTGRRTGLRSDQGDDDRGRRWDDRSTKRPRHPVQHPARKERPDVLAQAPADHSRRVRAAVECGGHALLLGRGQAVEEGERAESGDHHRRYRHLAGRHQRVDHRGEPGESEEVLHPRPAPAGAPLHRRVPPGQGVHQDTDELVGPVVTAGTHHHRGDELVRRLQSVVRGLPGKVLRVLAPRASHTARGGHQGDHHLLAVGEVVVQDVADHRRVNTIQARSPLDTVSDDAGDGDDTGHRSECVTVGGVLRIGGDTHFLGGRTHGLGKIGGGCVGTLVGRGHVVAQLVADPSGNECGARSAGAGDGGGEGLGVGGEVGDGVRHLSRSDQSPGSSGGELTHVSKPINRPR